MKSYIFVCVTDRVHVKTYIQQTSLFREEFLTRAYGMVVINLRIKAKFWEINISTSPRTRDRQVVICD